MNIIKEFNSRDFKIGDRVRIVGINREEWNDTHVDYNEILNRYGEIISFKKRDKKFMYENTDPKFLGCRKHVLEKCMKNSMNKCYQISLDNPYYNSFFKDRIGTISCCYLTLEKE